MGHRQSEQDIQIDPVDLPQHKLLCQVDPLTKEPQGKEIEKIAGTGAGIPASLPEKEGKNGQGQSAYVAKDPDLGKKQDPQVVHQHGHTGQYLQCITRHTNTAVTVEFS